MDSDLARSTVKHSEWAGSRKKVGQQQATAMAASCNLQIMQPTFVQLNYEAKAEDWEGTWDTRLDSKTWGPSTLPAAGELQVASLLKQFCAAFGQKFVATSATTTAITIIKAKATATAAAAAREAKYKPKSESESESESKSKSECKCNFLWAIWIFAGGTWTAAPNSDWHSSAAVTKGGGRRGGGGFRRKWQPPDAPTAGGHFN